MSTAQHNGVINYYYCEACYCSWDDEWDCECECDDECPNCGADISPEESDHYADCTHPECAQAE